MILLLISGIAASGIVFFVLKSFRFPIWMCASGSGLIFLMIFGLALYAFSKIDEPPPGARTVTQEELEEAAR